jgi:voltage-gated potassium channel
MKQILIKHRATAIVVGLFVTLYAVAVTAYAVCDHHTIGDSLWWAFVTFTTVGYGDQYPTSAVGRIAGVLLVVSSVFLAIPIITAHIVTKLMNDEHLFTHEEQEEVKQLLREIHAHLKK